MENEAPGKNKTKFWLKRTSRFSAWALLAVIIVLLISGWGITQTGVIYNATFGLIDRGLANLIHRSTTVPLAVFFLLHVFANIKLATLYKFNRAYIGWLVNVILIVCGIGLMVIVVYLEYFRRGG